ncbi:MAG: ribose 5-phosphate isomerase B [Deltaproteobacteria bacterium]|nr:ribose 5-phosphate isomerase B [Deltaproteobacteria bacterium]
MKIVIGSDHAGFKMKNEIVDYLKRKNIEVIDVGAYSEESVDYPDIAQRVVKEVLGLNCLGILVCGTGIGMSITANKFKGIRCALCYNEYAAEYARRHNDANIIALGGRTMDIIEVKKMLDIFIKTPFEAGRHERRLNKIKELEG